MSITVRPYNFNLNPLVEERLDIERIFAYQSGAVEFLLNHGFRMELPFTMGVPYLSRDEAKLAKQLAYDRLDKTNIEDLYLKDDDIQSLEFVKRAREKKSLHGNHLEKYEAYPFIYVLAEHTS